MFLDLHYGIVLLPGVVLFINISVIEPVDLDWLFAISHANESAWLTGINVLENFHATRDSRLLFGSGFVLPLPGSAHVGIFLLLLFSGILKRFFLFLLSEKSISAGFESGFAFFERLLMLFLDDFLLDDCWLRLASKSWEL